MPPEPETAAPACPIHQLVEALAEITRQRGLLGLEDTLFNALHLIWPQSECWMVKIPWESYPTRDNLIVHGNRATLPIDLALAALQLKGREALEMRAQSGRHYTSAHIPQPDEEEAELFLLATPAALDEPAQRLLTALLRIYRNQLELLQAGERDLLTGVLSRRVLARHITDQLAARLHGRRYREEGNADYLVLLNLDHFSRINREYGHLAADRVLYQAAQVIQESLHEGDRVFRQPGDEFAFLLIDTPPHMVREVCERLRQRFAARAFECGRMSVSLGYCAMPHDRLPREIIENARAALEFAKTNGRDQVSDYAELVKAGLVGDKPDAEKTVELF